MKLTISQEGSNPIIIDLNDFERSTESANVNDRPKKDCYVDKLVKRKNTFGRIKFTNPISNTDDVYYYLDSLDDDIFAEDPKKLTRLANMIVDFLLEELVYLKSEYSEAEYDTIRSTITSNGYGDKIADEWINGLSGTVLLLVNEKIEGFIIFDDTKKEYHVSKLYISPNVRHRGYANKLLTIAENNAKKQDKDLSVIVVKTNKPAYSLYTKFGFKKV